MNDSKVLRDGPIDEHDPEYLQRLPVDEDNKNSNSNYLYDRFK